MKKIFMVSVLLLLLGVVVSPVWAEEMAKEGSSTGHGYYIGDLQVLPLSQDTVQINYDVGGISVDDSGKGLFHNSSNHILGTFQMIKGVIEDSGFIVTTLTNGDKAFLTYKSSGKWDGPDKTTIVKGVCTYVGGTGKVSGITGNVEFTRYTLQPPAKGKSASFSVTKSHWKIVEPEK